MNERPAELYGLMVPLEKERLLVPRGCVAEVVGYQTPQEMTGAPPWHLGMIKWNGRSVPLVSFEGCAGGDVPSPNARSRVVVLNALNETLGGGAMAILSQGFPQLVRDLHHVRTRHAIMRRSVGDRRLPARCDPEVHEKAQGIIGIGRDAHAGTDLSAKRHAK